MKSADLHLHSHCSDGAIAPEALVHAAKLHHLAAIAITDHDTFAGVAPALAVANGVQVIPGVELTCCVRSTEVHLLGYYFHDGWRELHHSDALRRAREIRQERVSQMVERFQRLGVAVTADDVQASVCGPSVGRVHVARALVTRGVVHSVEEAFARFLRPGKPAYVERPRIFVDEGIRLIRSCGGVPVLAHPGLSAIHDVDIREMCQHGLRGIEAFHPTHTPAQAAHYQQLAASLNLCVTGGSDAHDHQVGVVRIPYDWIHTLNEALPKIS